LNLPAFMQAEPGASLLGDKGVRAAGCSTVEPPIFAGTFLSGTKKPACAGSSVWCREEDSNLHGVTRQYLKLVRLPIPPSRHERQSRRGKLKLAVGFKGAHCGDANYLCQ
jgi:hypothetical protein